MLLAISMVTTSCSFAFVDRAPPRDKWPVENRFALDLDRCTAEPWLPIADGSIALGLGAGAVYLGRGADGENVDKFVDFGLLMLPALVYLISSVYGFSKNSDCRTYLAGPPY